MKPRNAVLVSVALLALSLLRCEAAREMPARTDGLDAALRISDDEPTKLERQALKFLLDNMPDADRQQFRYDQLVHQVRLALKARSDNDWAEAIPMDVWLNYVLPYANLDEPREDWRSLFYPKLAPLVSYTGDPLEAAMDLNYRIWTLDGWNISFRAEQTPEIMAPSAVIAHGYASCTGLAIFLVNACRAVGIPARVAGTPEWVDSGGNHNWVEVWSNGVWSFTGPIEYDNRQWNRTWFFPDPVQKAKYGNYKHAVYAASYKRTNKIFPLAWRDDFESQVSADDVTKYYLAAAAALPKPPPAASAAEAGGEGGNEGGGGGGSTPGHDVAAGVGARRASVLQAAQQKQQAQAQLKQQEQQGEQ